jgi:AcrR family transcriptional regulator
VEPTLSRAERKKLEMRREIVEAAFDCFAEKGYHATGIADIAARLGIGHGTFYRYYANKRDIIDHVINDLIERTMAALSAENAADAAQTLAEYRAQTARIADALIGLVEQEPRIARLIIEAAAVDPELHHRMLDTFELCGQIIASYLRHGVEVGYLRPDLDVEQTGRVVTGMMLAVAVRSMRDPDPAGLHELAAAVLVVMYDGITP